MPNGNATGWLPRARFGAILHVADHRRQTRHLNRGGRNAFVANRRGSAMWGVGANCYAYACNEDHPVNGLRGAAVPGGYADRGVFVRQGDTAETYANRLIEGV